VKKAAAEVCANVTSNILEEESVIHRPVSVVVLSFVWSQLNKELNLGVCITQKHSWTILATYVTPTNSLLYILFVLSFT
jgi:hypothetical protein